ncbi:hypothetical protein [Acinetobacter soli]|uniref:hypothetical protein n=1 Tax=Acinetobacter soli TaxID=487316 RepID=UPI001D09C146|nr:hypothetical protein [Acinetobacter soli]MCB8770138.1 hypothetical protein [Acinetobacter soli]
MIDLDKQRETVHNAVNTLFDIAKVQKAEIDMLNVDIANKQAEIDSLKAQLEQDEKVWISTDFMLPDEDEAVLFLDKNNTIHDGYLSTDYVDGPYGENGEDFGDNQTLWSSNSNGEEFLPSEIKYWMPRPSSKSGSSAGEQS